MRLDEILDGLPDMDLTVWAMYRCDSGRWHVVLEETAIHPLSHFVGDGETALTAMLEALRKAGIVVTDE